MVSFREPASALEEIPERQVMADRVSRALRQEADVRRNHEFFNGRNAARTPLSTVGHKRSSPTRSKFRRRSTHECRLYGNELAT